MLTAVFLAKILHDIFDCDFNRSVLLGSLTLIITAPWNYLVRPDSFLTLFIVSALYFFLRYLKVGIGSKTMSLLIAGFLCFLAIFSKQTGIVILLILSSFLVLKLRFKDLITLFLGVAAGMAAGALMYMPFASPFVYANIIAGVDNGIHIAGAFHKPFMGLVTKFGAIFFFDIAAIYYIMKNIKFKQLDDTIQCVLYCFAALFAYSFLSSFKKGAGIHYFNDFYLISIIVCAYVYSMVEKRSMMDKASVTGRAFHQMSFIVIVALALSVTFSNVYQFGYPNFKILQYGGKLDNHTVVKFMMSEIEKDPDLLIIDQSSYRIFISRFPGNIAFSHPHIIKCCSYPRKVYDYSGVHDIVQRGRVKYLITESAIKNFIDIDLVGEFPFYKRISGYNVYMHKSYSLKG
ncbi:MAG: glycosyltransferase family 39 protein [Nitrospira sp.]|nr:glycosyltransferase family 39 protein [Nitrospira sp.]